MRRSISFILIVLILASSLGIAAFSMGKNIDDFTPSIISAGNYVSMVIQADNSLWAWGTNAYDQLADESVFNSVEPIKIMDDVVSVDMGRNFSIAVKSDGSLWAWGRLDRFGQEENAPVQIMDEVVFAAASSDDIAYIKTDGSLWLCGDSVNLYSLFSQQGLIDEDIKEKYPLKIMEDVVFASVAESIYSGSVMAVKTDGSLWKWDINQDEDSEKIAITSINIFGLNDVASVSYTGSLTMVIKNDGSLWAWSPYSYIKIGNGSDEWAWSPVQIMEDVASVSIGAGHTLALKNDGSVWAWGENDYGQLGNGKITTPQENNDSYIPIKVMDDVAYISVGYEHSMAAKKDGSLWEWGEVISSISSWESLSSPIKMLDGVKLSDAPSSWAAEQVNAAISLGLVPRSLQSKYTQAMTRAEFCALAVALYENVKGVIIDRSTFEDTTDTNVEKAAAIGVVDGVGGNLFDPGAKLTREQAATMLSRLADAMGNPLPKQSPLIEDGGSLSIWAIEAVGQMQASGIMTGVGDNRFATQEPYTREQSIITIIRLYDIVKQLLK